MRRYLVVFLAILLIFSLVACGGNETPESSTASESSECSPPHSEPIAPESSEQNESEEPENSEPEELENSDPESSETETSESSGTNHSKQTTTTTKTRPSSSTTNKKTTVSRTIRTTTTKKYTTQTKQKESTTDTTVTQTTTMPTAAVRWETPMTDYKSNKYTECITYRTPLTNTYNKLTKDKELTIVYFGGSLTNGYGCTDIDKYSWRARSGEWFKQNFPNANIHTVDTAIGESGTYLGTYRVQKDVIGSKPDLLFIEYAINDSYSSASEKVAAMRFETIVREVRKALPYCDIVTILTTDRGNIALSKNLVLFPTAKGHNSIAEAYDLSVVNIGSGMARNIANITKNAQWWTDTTIWDTYFIDSVHPNNDGHEQYYLCVEEYLENSLLNTDYSGLSKKKRTTPTVQSDHLLDGNRQSIKGEDLKTHFIAEQSNGATYNSGKFTTSTSQTPHIGYFLVEKNGKATFTFDGTEFAVWTDRKSPTKLTYSVDGGAEKTISFGALNPTEVVSGLSSGKHTITISSNATMKIGALFTRDETKQTLKGAK